MKKRAHVWTPERLETLARIYPDTPSEEMSEILGLPASSIMHQASRMHLHRSLEFRRKVCDPKLKKTPKPRKEGEWHNKIRLTPEQEQWLIKHFRNTKNDVIMEKLGLKHSTLHRIAREYGLNKTPQFQRKCAKEAAQKAYESHVRNGTHPPKGYIIPRSREFCFKKGESNKDRLSPKRYRESVEKMAKKWRETYEADKRRWKWDLPQKTSFRFGRQTKGKISYRMNMRKKGYLEFKEHKNRLYYDENTKRRKRAEGNAQLHGIKILPLSEII